MFIGYPAYHLTGACISTYSALLLRHCPPSIVCGQGFLHVKDAARMEPTQLVLLVAKIISYLLGICLLAGATRR